MKGAGGGEARVFDLDVDLNDPGLAGWRSFLEAYFRIIRTLQTEMAAAEGLELTEYAALFHLYVSDDHALRMSDLADLAFLSRSAMTRVVDRLERVGYVVRRPMPGNQRSKLAVLTPVGLHQLRQAFPVHHGRLTHSVMNRLTTQEWVIFRGFMDRLG